MFFPSWNLKTYYVLLKHAVTGVFLLMIIYCGEKNAVKLVSGAFVPCPKGFTEDIGEVLLQYLLNSQITSQCTFQDGRLRI